MSSLILFNYTSVRLDNNNLRCVIVLCVFSAFGEELARYLVMHCTMAYVVSHYIVYRDELSRVKVDFLTSTSLLAV